MLTNIQSLFADILQSPEQRALQMRNEGLTRAELATRNLSGGGQLLAPLIAAQAQNAPMIEDMIRRGFGGLFGQDTRTESERIQGMLSQADTTTVEGASTLADMLRKQGYGAQAAEIDSQVAAKRQQQQLVEQSQESMVEMINSAGLEPRNRAMLMNLVGNNPNIDAMQVFNAIQEMGGVPDSVKALMVRADQLYEKDSPEWKAFIARGGMENEGNDQANAREREIADVMREFQLTRREAIQIVEGRVIQDPVTGVASTLDIATGELIPIPIRQQAPQPAPVRTVNIEPSDVTIDAESAVGIVPNVLGTWNRTVGQIPFFQIPTDRTTEQQNLRFLQNDAVNSWSVSSKPPVIEQERILALLPNPDEWFQNPREAQQKTLGFIDAVVQQYVEDLKTSQDQRVSSEVKKDVSARINASERMIRRALTPAAAQRVLEEASGYSGGSRSTLTEDEKNEVIRLINGSR